MSEENTARPRGTDSARIVEVIETRSIMGKGTEEDICRVVVQYWHKNGELIATIDPINNDQLEKGKEKGGEEDEEI